MGEHYYMVDTNIILAYVKRENELIKNFIDDHHNHFFYTETVEKEYTKPSLQFPEIPDIFKIIRANIPQQKITAVFESIEKIMNLTPTQKNKFMNDLTIILEAGFKCYAITPPDNFNEPLLLTNNLVLYNKFINIPQNKKLLEDIIGAYGLEHLIEVIRPCDVVVGYM